MKFYANADRSILLSILKENGAALSAGDEALNVLKPGSVDGAAEKHVPMIEVDGNRVTVTVSEVDHPALPEHHIEWIALETKCGMQCKQIPVGERAQAVFLLTDDDEAVAAYEHCNLHGLWMNKP